ncbi:hypothetical protein HK405_011659 [Cladochytrium tenue]|nr:hypothetical protein HK405_011659 [Cladochytrium tenue]
MRASVFFRGIENYRDRIDSERAATVAAANQRLARAVAAEQMQRQMEQQQQLQHDQELHQHHHHHDHNHPPEGFHQPARRASESEAQQPHHQHHDPRHHQHDQPSPLQPLPPARLASGSEVGLTDPAHLHTTRSHGKAPDWHTAAAGFAAARSASQPSPPTSVSEAAWSAVSGPAAFGGGHGGSASGGGEWPASGQAGAAIHATETSSSGAVGGGFHDNWSAAASTVAAGSLPTPQSPASARAPTLHGGADAAFGAAIPTELAQSLPQRHVGQELAQGLPANAPPVHVGEAIPTAAAYGRLQEPGMHAERFRQVQHEIQVQQDVEQLLQQYHEHPQQQPPPPPLQTTLPPSSQQPPQQHQQTQLPPLQPSSLHQQQLHHKPQPQQQQLGLDAGYGRLQDPSVHTERFRQVQHEMQAQQEALWHQQQQQQQQQEAWSRIHPGAVQPANVPAPTLPPPPPPYSLPRPQQSLPPTGPFPPQQSAATIVNPPFGPLPPHQYPSLMPSQPPAQQLPPFQAQPQPQLQWQQQPADGWFLNPTQPPQPKLQQGALAAPWPAQVAGASAGGPDSQALLAQQMRGLQVGPMQAPAWFPPQPQPQPPQPPFASSAFVSGNPPFHGKPPMPPAPPTFPAARPGYPGPPATPTPRTGGGAESGRGEKWQFWTQRRRA